MLVTFTLAAMQEIHINDHKRIKAGHMCGGPAGGLYTIMTRFQECIHRLKQHEVYTSTLALFGGIQLHIHGLHSKKISLDVRTSETLNRRPTNV